MIGFKQDISSIIKELPKTSGGDSGRASSNRDVQQSSDTIFRIRADEWNNVPKIVYEAMVTIINTIDSKNKASKIRDQKVQDKFDETRNFITETEGAIQE